jgi:hypothetical protein
MIPYSNTTDAQMSCLLGRIIHSNKCTIKRALIEELYKSFEVVSK